MANLVDVIESHTMDFSARVQHARRAVDGAWFSRVRSRGPWGYAWSRWRPAAEPASGRIEKARVRLPAAN